MQDRLEAARAQALEEADRAVRRADRFDRRAPAGPRAGATPRDHRRPRRGSLSLAARDGDVLLLSRLGAALQAPRGGALRRRRQARSIARALLHAAEREAFGAGGQGAAKGSIAGPRSPCARVALRHRDRPCPQVPKRQQASMTTPRRFAWLLWLVPVLVPKAEAAPSSRARRPRRAVARSVRLRRARRCEAWSDVDLLVEFDQPVGLFHFFRVQRRIADLLGCAVNLVMKDA